MKAKYIKIGKDLEDDNKTSVVSDAKRQEHKRK